MANESLELAETDDILAELAARFDNFVVAGSRNLTSSTSSKLLRFKAANLFEAVGLLDYCKAMVMKQILISFTNADPKDI